MPFALTVDQVGSRRRPDAVDAALGQLAGVATVLPFVRTVGDELQGLLGDPVSVVDAILLLMRNDQWHIGLGIGPVEEPLPDDSRAARGPAFLCARTAVGAAKSEPSHLAVMAPLAAADAAYDAQTVGRLTAALRQRRTAPGWQAVDLMATGLTQSEVAGRLQVSRQAVGQRLQAAEWSLEQAARPTLVRLLARADAAAAAA